MPVIAMYLRLSQEDKINGNPVDESNSIFNQRIMIKEYIYNNDYFKGYDVIEFCDDGYSGTSMDRPGMNQMLQELKKNRINCIIVKDLSRFSRDYIELGTYMNQILPFMGVRLISINDHYDSKCHNGTTTEIDTEFKTLLYDLYSKDISVKVKASLENKFSKGEYASGQVPFGYQKSQTVKNMIEINEKEAEIVRYIFSLAAQGKSSVQIAKQLYKEKIPTIKEFRGRKKEENGKVYTWNNNTVRMILNNRFYLGEMSYGKTVRKYAGSKSGIKIPKEKWKVIPGHHMPLVSEETFKKAAYLRPVHKPKIKPSKNLLVGKVYCGGCGYAMSYKKKGKYSKYNHFWCRKHSLLQIPECCTNYESDVLENLVSILLNNELVLRADAARQENNMVLFYQMQTGSIKKQLINYKTEQKKLQEKKDLLYENYALMEMPYEKYREKSKELESRLSSLALIINQKQDELTGIENERLKTSCNIKNILHGLELDILSQKVVDTFVKKIHVYKNKSIKIEWAFSENCETSTK